MPLDPEFNKRADEFRQRKLAEQRERQKEYGFNPEKFSDITTKKEAKDLEKQRETPEPHLTLEIGGTNEQEVVTELSQEREERIEYINDTLEERAQKFERDFDNSTLKNDPEIDR